METAKAAQVSPTLMPFDDLNALRYSLVYGQYTDADGKRRYVSTYADLEDEFEDILIMSYILGNKAAGEMLGIEPTVDVDAMEKAVNKKIADKTWRERLREQLDNGGTVEDIMRIAETESHRDTNEEKDNKFPHWKTNNKRFIAIRVRGSRTSYKINEY